ncbi:ABC transporter substrate-binding protein [Pantanalinema sp. GBBB05]|uniref:ABC transporter substrate-binding protein n=1 Tax=Pantanalinema sp. GBBB05 TaxID=2604139 RepID=UPI001DFF7354|nr:ABC transporter substrate-binding protein [Pantanalinema sp. GBBB05]
MSQLAILEFQAGTFETGFTIKLKLGAEQQRPRLEISGSLPPAIDLPQLYHHWQAAYRQMGAPTLRIQFPEAQITNVSIRDHCDQAAAAFKQRFNDWLSHEQLRKLRERLLLEIPKSEPIRVILQTSDPMLRRLPWQIWDLFEEYYPNAEIALSIDDYELTASRPIQSRVRILAILGNSSGIDLHADRQLLEKLPNAKVTFLVEPTLAQLNELLWEQQGWHIVFFAGHSSAAADDQIGRIYINSTDSLTIDELRHALKFAVHRGLRLAIFNSCDGLGLARQLADLHIPTMIVMREAIPDQVAHCFLKYFLKALAQGEPLYQAVRQAREQLQGLEPQFPYATWLPVICQNPAETPFLWTKKPPQTIKFSIVAGSVIAIGVAILASLSYPPSKGFRFSLGEKILITANATPQKQTGAEAFASKNYKAAIQQWQTSLKSNPNDPETRIYLNNAQAAKHGQWVKIAAVVPIGGSLDNATEMLRGIAQAQEEINQTATLIKGAGLQVEIASDDNRGDIAEQVATTLANDKQILAIVGHNSSAASQPAAAIYQKHGLVMVNPTASAPNILTGNYIFRITSTSRDHAILMSRYAIHTIQISKFAICSDTRSPSSQEWKDEFIAILRSEGSLVSTIPCDLSDPQFNPVDTVSKITADQVRGLLLLPSAERVTEAIQVAKAARGLMLFGNTILYTPNTLQIGKSDVSGMILAVAWHPQVAHSSNFLSNSQKLWHGAINWRTVMAYDATQTVIAGLQQSQTREQLQKVLSQPGFSVQGATGEITFLPSGERKHTPGLGILVRVEPDPQSPSGYNFLPLKQ